MTERSTPAGNIYDLGYRPYEGQRFGRRYAIVSLYLYSLKTIFGLGRSATSKVFPFGLAVVCLLPAAAQLAVAAIAPRDVEFIKPESYFSFVQIVIALFCAVVAPEIIGRDQRNRTLPLYFSRALSRADYVSAKVGALAVGLLIVVLLPQIVLFLGNVVATNDLVYYLQHNVQTLAPIVASSTLVATFMAGLSLVIASQTPRRALATGAVLLYYVILTVVASVLVETTTGTIRSYVILLSPFDVLNGAVHWIFSVAPPADSDLAKADLWGGAYLITALGYIAVSLGLLYRRFQKLAV
jgi:ABC-2 type transport system permease protein